MLENFTKAHELNEELHEILIKNKIHFRGNVGSLSLISLSKITAELGIKCDPKKYKNVENKGDQLIKDIEKLKKSKTHIGRDTKEKELQAWIIYNSILNKGYLPFDKTIKFIACEVALPSKNGPKVVCDILGFSEKRKTICIIELKSSRDKKRLIEQVDTFEGVINFNKAFFHQLLNDRGYNCEQDISKMIEKIIVWPHEQSLMTSKALSKANITEYGYIMKADGYVFIKM